MNKKMKNTFCVDNYRQLNKFPHNALLVCGRLLFIVEPA